MAHQGQGSTEGRGASGQVTGWTPWSVTCTGVSGSCQGLGPQVSSISREAPGLLLGLPLKPMGGLVQGWGARVQQSHPLLFTLASLAPQGPCLIPGVAPNP